jgi:hypothetical protein
VKSVVRFGRMSRNIFLYLTAANPWCVLRDAACGGSSA